MDRKWTIKNILFDFDGTLFDTQKVHSEVESSLLKKYGVSISAEEITKKYSGIRTNEFFARLLKNKELADELVRQKWDILFKQSYLAKELADLNALFSLLRSRSILFGIGTASPRRWVDSILSNGGLDIFFDENSIIGGDMVKNGKPHKETWLRLQKNIPAENCLVVEDGVSGCIAAISAKIPFVVLGERNERFPKEAIYINSLEDIILIID